MVMTVSENKESMKLEVMEGFRERKWKGKYCTISKIMEKRKRHHF